MSSPFAPTVTADECGRRRNGHGLGVDHANVFKNLLLHKIPPFLLADARNHLRQNEIAKVAVAVGVAWGEQQGLLIGRLDNSGVVLQAILVVAWSLADETRGMAQQVPNGDAVPELWGGRQVFANRSVEDERLSLQQQHDCARQKLFAQRPNAKDSRGSRWQPKFPVKLAVAGTPEQAAVFQHGHGKTGNMLILHGLRNEPIDGGIPWAQLFGNGWKRQRTAEAKKQATACALSQTQNLASRIVAWLV